VAPESVDIMASLIVLRVSPKAAASVKAYATRKGIPATEAADAMILLAASRHASLGKQGAKRKKERKVKASRKRK
jgi:hypothetical protein